MRAALLAVTVVFLVAHAACLPASLADLDSINFALGVRDFDVSRHQPHPPGYPVFIAAAKASTALVETVGVAAPAVRGLSLLSAVAGATLIPLLFVLFLALTADRTVAAWAAVVTAAAPLFWFNALRPLSDVTGLAVAVAAQVLLIVVILQRRPPGDRARWVALGAMVCGVAIGVRSQNFLMTLPLLGAAVLVPRSGLREKDRLIALAMAVAGVLLWAVPMLIVSGGLESYLQALRDQAGEDFSGVVMLWTSRTPRVAADALAYSLLWPWGNLVAGGIVVVLACAGAIRMLVRAPWAFATVVIAFLPYAVFHLLFHETVTTRYALPLVVPMALLSVYALAGMGRLPLHAGGAALVVWSLAVTLPPSREYATTSSPAARALDDASAAAARGHSVAMHAVMLRSQQWYQGVDAPNVIRRQHAREISGLVDLWRREPQTTVTFLANPRRTDLARLDPRARTLTRAYDWSFPELPLLGGVRPGAVDLVTMQPPGWMLGEGWALTAEIGGQTARIGAGPLRQPAIAWVRSRPGGTTLMIGGRVVAAPARISISSGDQVVDVFEASPGFFFESRELPAGSLDSGDAYIPLEVTATAADESTQVDLFAFDLQSEGVPMVGAVAGWHEPELNPGTGRAWRWMSERATLWVRPVGRDVTVRLSGESPLRYFDTPPDLRAMVAGQTVGRLAPGDDFTWQITVPAHLLSSASQALVIQSDSSFVPGNGDPRNLALRIYAISAE